MKELLKTKDLQTRLKIFFDGRVEDAEVDWIICFVCGLNRGELYQNKPVSASEERECFKLAQKRVKGIPLCYLFGESEFYGLKFKVCKDVLIPRFETELLVELIIKNEKQGSGLDIGTGSGAIAITLARLAGLDMTAVDISKKALKIAKQNAKQNDAKVKFLQSDLLEKVEGAYDFIVSNPPYIKSADILSLQTEVKDHEPHLALDGGADGLDFYRKITESAVKHLKKNGRIYYEIGIGQSAEVQALLQKDFKDITVVQDYSGIDRIVYAKLK